MGGALNYSKTQMSNALSKALSRYRTHDAAGDDMVKAGKELAAAVARLVVPRPCSQPRESFLNEQSLEGLEGLEGLQVGELVGEAIDLDELLNVDPDE